MVVERRCVSSSCSLFLREAGRYSARLLLLSTITVLFNSIGLLLLLSCDAAVSYKFVDAHNELYPT
jgi:hypothetical protein